MMSQAADLETLKNVPGFKVILKAVLRSQIQQLVDQLSSLTHEESMLLTVSLDDGAICQLGSESGKHFLKDYTDVRMKFLKFCLRNPSKQYLDAADPQPQASRPAASASRTYLDATDPGHPQMKVSRSKLRKTSTFTASSSTVQTRPQPYPKSRRSGVDDMKKGATGSARKMGRNTRNVPKLSEENLVDCDRTKVEHECELRGNTDSRLQSDFDSVNIVTRSNSDNIDSVTKDSHSKNRNRVIFDTSADIGDTEQSSKSEDDHTTSGNMPNKWNRDEISKSEMDHTISENSRNKTGIINSGDVSGLGQGIDQERGNITGVVNTPYKTGISKTRSGEISGLEQGIDQERGNTCVVNMPSKAVGSGDIFGLNQGIDREDRGITGQGKVHLHRDVKHEAVHDAAADIGSFIEDAVTGYENSQNTPVLIGHMDGLVEAKSQVANEGADNFVMPNCPNTALSSMIIEPPTENASKLDSENCGNESSDVIGTDNNKTMKCCSICGLMVSSKQLSRHLRAHKGGRFKCGYCCVYFDDDYLFRKHQAEKHSQTYVCETCGSTFRRKSSLVDHFVAKHGNSPKHTCHICRKTFFRRCHLQDHINSHNELTPHKCSRCDKSYSRIGSMKRHQRLCRGLAQCTVCERKFNSWKTLQNHCKKEGLSTADLECSELNGESLQSYNWNTAASATLQDNVDISVYSNQSDEVDVAMHGNSYAEHSNVVKSTGTHQKRKRSTERNHQCAICQKYFVYNWQVVRHMRIHTGEKPFACNYCDYKTGRKDILKYHKLKNHLYLLRSDLLVGVDHT